MSLTAQRAALAAPDGSLRMLERGTGGSSVISNPQPGSLLSIDEHRVGRRVVLTAVGEVDIDSAAHLRRALETARDDGAAEIWLDLTHTTFMDGKGLCVLVDLHDSLRDANQRFVVICPAGPVLRLLALTGADCELEIHPTRAAAQYGD